MRRSQRMVRKYEQGFFPVTELSSEIWTTHVTWVLPYQMKTVIQYFQYISADDPNPEDTIQLSDRKIITISLLDPLGLLFLPRL